MASAFPANLDVLSNPTPTDNLNTPGVVHSDQHANANDAIEAIEAAIGITGSADVNSLEYRMANLLLGLLTFREADGSPAITRKTLVVPNNTLTDTDADTATFVPLFRRLGDVTFTSFSGLAGRNLQINAAETGVEAVAPYDLVSLTPENLVVAEDAPGNRVTLTHYPVPSSCYFQTAPATNSQALAAALTEWPNSQRRQYVDLTHATQIRLVVRAVTAFAAGTKLAGIYTLDNWANFSYFDGTGASGGTGPVAAMDAANTTVKSGWVTLHANAKADIQVAIAGVGGDGSTTGNTIGPICLQYR